MQQRIVALRITRLLDRVTTRNWQTEAELYLAERFVEYCAAVGVSAPLHGIRIRPALTSDEAENLLLGIDNGLFTADGAGQIRSVLPSAVDDAEGSEWAIFDSVPPSPRLVREHVCLLATAASLVLNRGWPVKQVELWTGRQAEVGSARSADLLVRSLTGAPLAAVIAKRSAVELEKLAHDFPACCRRGPHSNNECGFQQNHPRFDFCIEHRPGYVWGVAPGAEFCFRLSYTADRIMLTDLPSLPPRSYIE